MDEYKIDTEVITTGAGTFKIDYYQDVHADSPRDTCDNLSDFVIDTRDCYLDEGHDGGTVRAILDEVNHGAVSPAGACRYLRLALGSWAVVPVHVQSQSYTIVRAGDPTDTDTGARVDGFAFDTPRGRKTMAPENDEAAEAWIREEIAAYSRWTEGEYVGFTVSRLVDELDEIDPQDAEDEPDAYAWDDLDSLWGIDEEDYARSEAREVVESYRASEFPSPVVAVQV